MITSSTAQPLEAYVHQFALDKAIERGEASVRRFFLRSCPFCGGHLTMEQDAAVATGLLVEYPEIRSDRTGAVLMEGWSYQPMRGEVLKNHYMVCGACGADEIS